MKAQAEVLLEDEMKIVTGAAYLIPESWWEETCIFNFDAKSIGQLEFPQLNLANYVQTIALCRDTFILDFEQGILSQIQHKCNYLKFAKTSLSPEIRKDIQWKVISPALWNRIANHLHLKFSVLIYYDSENPTLYFTDPCMQVQMVFCAKNKSQAFVGFLPKESQIIPAVRSISYELGFIQMQNSRIVFPENNPEKLSYFHQLEKKKVCEIPDTLLMAFNMETAEAKQKDISFGKNDVMGDSNQAVAGEQDIWEKSWEHLRNDGTMSTGAETPSFVFSQQNNGEFRVRELFRQKKPQEISQMKIHAEKCINGPLIPIKPLSQEELELQLEALALEILEISHAHKKKTYKEKELE